MPKDIYLMDLRISLYACSFDDAARQIQDALPDGEILVMRFIKPALEIAVPEMIEETEGAIA